MVINKKLLRVTFNSAKLLLKIRNECGLILIITYYVAKQSDINTRIKKNSQSNKRIGFSFVGATIEFRRKLIFV